MKTFRIILSVITCCIVTTCATMPGINSKVCYKGACVNYDGKSNTIGVDVDLAGFIK